MTIQQGLPFPLAMSFTASYKKLHFSHSIHLHHFTHTKAPFELFRKSTVKERTWLNCTSDNGWLTPVLQTPALCCLRRVTKLPRNIQNNNKKKISSSCLILGSGGSSDSDWVQRPLIFWLEDFRFDACSRNNRGWRSPFSSSPGGVYGACSSSRTTHGNIKLRPTRAW